MMLSEAILAYLRHAELVKGYSQKTVLQYEHHLRKFFEWAGDISLRQLTLELVLDYKKYLLGTGIKASTVGEKIKVLRLFLQQLRDAGKRCLDPRALPAGKCAGRRITFLTQEEFVRLISVVNAATLEGKRDRAILEFFFATGARLEELVKLDRKDVKLDEGEAVVIGKGGKPGTLYLNARARERLREYLQARTDNYPALFSYVRKRNEQSSGRIGKRTVWALVKRYMRAAGLPNDMTVHSLRHSFATHLIKSGVNIKAVQELMRHASLASTEVYLHYVNVEIKELHKKAMEF
jgi:site-specific recombinase XerD